MKKWAIASLSALAAQAALADTQQSTYLSAPVTAIALGPANASVTVNGSAAGSHNVVVRRPLTAIATPWRPVHIRVNRHQSFVSDNPH